MPQEDEEEGTIYECGNCGVIIKEDDVFCPSCNYCFLEEFIEPFDALDRLLGCRNRTIGFFFDRPMYVFAVEDVSKYLKIAKYIVERDIKFFEDAGFLESVEGGYRLVMNDAVLKLIHAMVYSVAENIASEE